MSLNYKFKNPESNFSVTCSVNGCENNSTRLIQGGRFEHGFMAGFFSSLSGSGVGMIKTAPMGLYAIVGAATGGTAEALGGGKFANGAVTGAFVGMFNDALHSNPQTGAIPKDLTEDQKKSVLSIVEEATRQERIRMYNNRINYDDPNYEDNSKIYLKAEVSGVDAGYYSTGECDIFCGNKNVKAEVIYTPSNNSVKNTIVGITTPGVDNTNGRIWMINNNSYKHPIIELRFKTKSGYNTYNKFINGNEKY